ncbi:zinc finger CCCH domain-containing protein 41-like [Dorcoceras hygrometricum]|uniref:Zinc finger CCCH domain-containing protein 41-like n=1 Tax=Dorcoceras hygrometricum TaxID=472368 RepID=A0A2Z7BEM8_9LAMI|nr:zinc finger CCCH domain-containing protein 41-like [Dorcoceras hygrometricum]
MSIRRLYAELRQNREQYRSYRAQAGLPIELPESYVYGAPSNAQNPGVTGGKIEQKTTQSSANVDEKPVHGQTDTRGFSTDDIRTLGF